MYSPPEARSYLPVAVYNDINLWREMVTKLPYRQKNTLFGFRVQKVTLYAIQADNTLFGFRVQKVTVYASQAKNTLFGFRVGRSGVCRECLQHIRVTEPAPLHPCIKISEFLFCAMRPNWSCRFAVQNWKILTVHIYFDSTQGHSLERRNLCGKHHGLNLPPYDSSRHLV